MSRRLSDYDDYQFVRGLGDSDEECERVEDFSQASGWRCVDHGACREKGKVCSYNPMYPAGDCKEEEKAPGPGDWRQAGNLYYPQWLELFDSRERWWAIELGLRPKPGAAWGSVGEWGFQPSDDERTNQWIRGWFQATSPRERIRFFDKDGARIVAPLTKQRELLERVARDEIRSDRECLGRLPIRELEILARRYGSFADAFA